MKEYKDKQLLNNEVPLAAKSIEEIHQEVYGEALGSKIITFNDSREALDFPGYNRNQVEAMNYLLPAVSRSDNRLSVVLGAMRAGKGRCAELLSQHYRDKKVVGFQHKIGTFRFEDCIATRDVRGALIRTSCEAASYDSFVSLVNQTKDVSNTCFLIDEFQFLSKIDESDFRQWKARLQEKDSKAVILALDFDYRTQPWENTKLLINQADSGVLLAARCFESGETAWRTFRRDHLPDGQVIPASFSGQTIVSDDASNITSSYVPASDSVYRQAYGFGL